jgi:hypothetical protein
VSDCREVLRREGVSYRIIANVDVRPEGQRKGIGTTMYELVFDMTCKHKLQMASSSQRSVFGESFWKKQIKKGRARCAISNSDKTGNYWDGPLQDLEERIAVSRPNEYGEPDYDYAAREMKKLNIPKPRRGPDGHYWPCRQYVIKKGHCGWDRKLNGAPKAEKCRYGKVTRGARKGQCRLRPKR